MHIYEHGNEKYDQTTYLLNYTMHSHLLITKQVIKLSGSNERQSVPVAPRFLRVLIACPRFSTDVVRIQRESEDESVVMVMVMVMVMMMVMVSIRRKKQHRSKQVKVRMRVVSVGMN